MRIAVSEQAHASAVEALVEGNQLSAQAVMGLSDRLASYAGMAGDDSTATEFAASYDEAAVGSVTAVESLVGAFAALAGLVEASLANHAHAEAASVLPGWPAPRVGPLSAGDRCHWVRVPAPPSSLGAETSPPGGVAGLVLDFLQDVFWPNADTDRVRDAAATWSAAAQALGLLAAHCDSAAWALEDERSPEIPLALGVLADLRGRIGDLAAQLGDLAEACTEYADVVDARRAELLDLLEGLAKELAAGAVITGVLSGGTALLAGGAAGAARIASAGAKFRGILDSLRIAAAGSALKARPVAVTAGEVGTYTQKISRARVMLMDAGRGAGARTGRPGFTLAAHEGPTRGHTLDRHVGKSVEYLRDRAATHPTAKRASTFVDKPAAERFIHQVLQRRADEIQEWLRTAQPTRRLDDVLEEVTGISVDRAGVVTEVRGVRMMLVRDSSMPDGYWIKTAFPQP